jgi:hypothetical protein
MAELLGRNPRAPEPVLRLKSGRVLRRAPMLV